MPALGRLLVAISVATMAALACGQDPAATPPPSCGRQETNCNGVCVDLYHDDANCGSCGDRCTDGKVCIRSECRILCTDKTDKSSDPQNCGTCENACQPDESCVGGKCTTPVIEAGPGVDAGFDAGPPCAPGVVIAEAFADGGNGPMSDFVVLLNRNATPAPLGGWSLQFVNGFETSWSVMALSGSIKPHGFYLVQLASDAGGTPLPAPDAVGTFDLQQGGVRIALVSSLTALTGQSPTGYVDAVSVGNTYDTEGISANHSSGRSVRRRASRCADTNVNETDFQTALPTALNASSPVVTCACP